MLKCVPLSSRRFVYRKRGLDVVGADQSGNPPGRSGETVGDQKPREIRSIALWTGARSPAGSVELRWAAERDGPQLVFGRLIFKVGAKPGKTISNSDPFGQMDQFGTRLTDPPQVAVVGAEEQNGLSVNLRPMSLGELGERVYNGDEGTLGWSQGDQVRSDSRI